METLLVYLKGAIAIAITFGLAVFVHEFGHMLFALLRGVGVESFAIGMGPKITSWKWRGIDFSLRWFPVGGFVKLGGRTPPGPTDESPAGSDQTETSIATVGDVEVDTGEKKEEKSLSESSYDDLYALQDKGFLTKVMVFGGGVFMNFVTACVAIAVVLMIGHQVDRFRFEVEKVAPGSVAAKAGLQAGDKVVAYNGEPIQYYMDFFEKLDAQFEKNKKPLTERLGLKATEAEKPIQFSLTVQRAGGEKTVNFPPVTSEQLSKWPDEVTIRMAPLIGGVVPNYPADNAGIKVGDRITAINGKPVSTFAQMAEVVSNSIDKQISVTVLREGKEKVLAMTPKPGIEDAKKGQIGITVASEEKELIRESNPLKAVAIAPLEAIARIKFYIAANVNFFRQASFKQVRENVGGPIAIAAFTAKAAQGGLVRAIDWFITLNLLLLIFNLLPLPVLDGGFIVLAFVEAVIRRPVPPRVLGPIYTAFVIGFILLIVLISVQDVVNWGPKLFR